VDESLCSRPMGRIREPLVRMGATVELLGPGGRPPVRITGGKLKAIDYALPVASAQVKSCVLLAGLYRRASPAFASRRPPAIIQNCCLPGWVFPFASTGQVVELEGLARRGRGLRRAPGGSGGFFIGGLLDGGRGRARRLRMVVHDVGLNPRRTALALALARMGARIRRNPIGRPQPEPCGRIEVEGVTLRGTEGRRHGDPEPDRRNSHPGGCRPHWRRGRLLCGTQKSCGSRSRTASRAWRPTCAGWGCRWRKWRMGW